MSAETDAWRARWQTTIECRDCGARYECENPDCTLNRVGAHGRLVLLRCPEVCPECKNLKLVKEGP